MLVRSKVDITLHEAVNALTSVIPTPIHVLEPELISAPIHQAEIGVLIGLTGEIRGRLIIEADMLVFSKVGEIMFGMALEGEMLDSFTGELGNMIAGNLTTGVSQQSIAMDITPPTVIVGETKLYGFNQAIFLAATIENCGQLNVILSIEE